MNSIIRKVSLQAFKNNHRQFIVQSRRFASDTKTLDEMTKKNKVVIFMKGNPETPRCGFSNAVVQILRMHGVESYDAHDVLLDDNLRQGIKDYSSWPTIPIVYINGEFVGGCDILLQMHKDGTLIDSLWNNAGIKSALAEEISDDKK